MSPPNNIHLIDINPLTLTISWTPSPLNCLATYSYYVISLTDDCGLQCPNTSVDTNAICNITSVSGQMCSVFVQTVHCGGILVGNRSEPLEITLKSRSQV